MATIYVDASNPAGITSIQAAIIAAVPGDTISVAAGIYDEDLIIDKVVTIVGVHFGVAGTGGVRDPAAGAGETTIIGTHNITATGVVTIDGVRFLNDATTTGGGGTSATLQIQPGSGFDHVITNSIFFSTVAGGANGVDDYAIFLPPITTGVVTISNNYFTGSSVGDFTTASWGRGIWFDGGGVGLDVTGNTFQYVRSGINLDDTSGLSAATVSGNTFATNGTAITSVVFNAAGGQLTNNNFENVGTDFNFRNVPTDVIFDAATAVGTVTLVNPINDPVLVYGGVGNDQILGTEGADALDGNNLSPGNADNDLLSGRGGNDLLLGRGGDDTLEGGAGTDTAIYVGIRANFSIGVTSNVNGFVTAFDAVANPLPGDQGADTLSEIEVLRFIDVALDLNDPVQLFNSGNDLVGTFGNIQAAFDAMQGASTVRTVDDITYVFDALESHDYTLIQNVDGTLSSYTDYDQMNAETWVYVHSTLDSQGLVDITQIQNDDGSSSFTDYDQANANPWEYVYSSLDSQGLVDTTLTQNDDGSSSYTDYDQANANPWVYTWSSYDSQGLADSTQIQNDDGSSSYTDYDQANANPWEYTYTSFDSQGLVVSTVIQYDDGSILVV